MGLCCGSSDKIVKHSLEDVHHESESAPLKYDPEFNGPSSKRSCTDVICLLLFIVFLCCWGFVGFYAFTNGDIDRLLVPTDSRGLKCGVDSEVLSKPYLVFFNISECAKIDVPIYGCQTPQVCVEKCPDTEFFFESSLCNAGNVETIKKKLICEHNVQMSEIRTCRDIETYTSGGRCAKYYLKSDPFSKRCVPTDLNESIPDILLAVDNMKILATINGVGQMVVEDLMSTWKYIILALVVSMVVCLIFIAMMRWVATPIVWFSIAGVIALLSYAVYYSYYRFNEILQHPVETHVNISPNLNSLVQSWLTSKNVWLSILIITSILLIIILLVVLVLRKRIVIAIALVGEGSKAVTAIKSTVFFPVFPWIFEVVVIAFSIAVGLSLASVGEPVHRIMGLGSSESCICTNGYKDGDICDPAVFNTNCQNTRLISIFRDGKAPCSDAACHFQHIDSPDIVSYFHAVNILGFFWVVCFISAFGDMVLAAAFATWYWTFKKTNMPFFVLTKGLGRTVRYHLGTLAFGSLIISICKIIRLLIEYIDQKLKKYDNSVTKGIMCCCRCFFWCLEKFLKFLNTNAYIMCAIHGKNFCGSAKDAFSLLMRNFLRVIALDKVAGFLFFLSKVLISLGMGAVTYTYFTSNLIDLQLHYDIVPAIIVIIGTYLISSVFFGVYSMAVDTLFLCFLEDCERNDGTAEKPYYMSKQLMKILGKKQK